MQAKLIYMNMTFYRPSEMGNANSGLVDNNGNIGGR